MIASLRSSHPSHAEAPEPPAHLATEEDGQELAPVGPSIRTFLRGLLWEPPAPAGESAPDAPPIDAPPMALAPDAVSPLDSLFPGGARGDVDDTMASLLAGGYREDEAADDPLRGVPAHRATGELSLEHVFGDQPGSDVRASAEATPPGGHGFLNQFFAAGTSGGDAEDGGVPPSEAQASPAEDIEQFNAWLQGLRNT